MPTTFFTLERLDKFWFYVKWFMSYNMPMAMICLAALVAYLVLDMIIDVIMVAKKVNDDDSDDDVDREYY
ncbi:hypothetical protein [Paenibacillus agricola]|uniref:TMhelix containing protein n=1 Tax=Paenibacillus agricola TaxID=2716264 RepID=A0ABX0JI60_9BACL|nr:hypothetical protein [Paenibacillus agricola]NHN35541.1 hypothetical protein [Paenibacillus agricola]